MKPSVRYTKDQLKGKFCDPCRKKGKQSPVRTFCFECREVYCQECSDNHLLYTVSESHSLIDLYQHRAPATPGIQSDLPSNLLPSNVNEPSSDILESLSISENTVFYGAQVAVESRKGKPRNIDVESKKIETDHLKVTNLADVVIKTSDDVDDVWAISISAISDKVVVADFNNAVLKLFSNKGKYLSSFRTSSIGFVHGMTKIRGETFSTCGTCKKVHNFSIRGHNIVKGKDSYDMDHDGHGISYNGTYYSVLHADINAISILDRQGKKVRKIEIKEVFGRNVSLKWGIHMDIKTHNIFLLCTKDRSGMLCLSVEGVPLWFTPVDGRLNGITEIHDVLAVPDLSKCIHLISKTGQYQRKLLESKDLKGDPFSVFFDQRDNKLYVGYSYKNIISIYSKGTDIALAKSPNESCILS